MIKQFLALCSGYGYCVELIISAIAVALFPARHKRTIWRMVVAVLGLFMLSMLWAMVDTWITPLYITPLGLGVYDIIEYCSIFIYLSFCIWFINRGNVRSTLFLAVGAYSVQHLVYKVAEVISYLGKYISTPFSVVLYLLISGALYVAAFFVFRKCFKKLRGELVQVSSVVLLVTGMLLIAVILQYSVENDSPYYYIYAFYDIVSGVLLLLVMRSIIVNGELKRENEMLEYIRWQENERYELERKNVEQLDIKLHDIKHLIYGLKESMGEEDFYDVERLISVYDMTVKTDNEALDIIFSQKSLKCEQSHIRFERVVDGELLSFMDKADVYSLFSNAIDNAIEACMTNDDQEKRIISLMVRESMQMVHIHMENYFKGEIRFKDGLPITTKKQKAYHGFGTKSIRNVVEKYGGTLNMSAKNNMFSLDILIPIPR